MQVRLCSLEDYLSISILLSHPTVSLASRLTIILISSLNIYNYFSAKGDFDSLIEALEYGK